MQHNAPDMHTPLLSQPPTPIQLACRVAHLCWLSCYIAAAASKLIAAQGPYAPSTNGASALTSSHSRHGSQHTADRMLRSTAPLRAQHEWRVCVGIIALQAGVLREASCCEALTDLRHQRPAAIAAVKHSSMLNKTQGAAAEAQLLQAALKFIVCQLHRPRA
jgi:hypothetical protein